MTPAQAARPIQAHAPTRPPGGARGAGFRADESVPGNGWTCGVTGTRRSSYDRGMALDLFAGIPVTEYAAALKWYERLLGSPPAFFPNDTEAVWELAEHRYVFIEQRPERAGHALHTIFVDDLDAIVAQITERGSTPRSGRPTPTACARSPTATPTATRSGSAAPCCDRPGVSHPDQREDPDLATADPAHLRDRRPVPLLAEPPGPGEQQVRAEHQVGASVGEWQVRQAGGKVGAGSRRRSATNALPALSRISRCRRAEPYHSQTNRSAFAAIITVACSRSSGRRSARSAAPRA